MQAFQRILMLRGVQTMLFIDLSNGASIARA